MSFKICTFNCNGLNDKMKRKQCFQWSKNNNIDVICIQETHCGSQEIENKWKQEWGDPKLSYFVNHTNKSCGVATLINPKSNVDVVDNNVLIEGRALLTTLRLLDFNNEIVKIVNLYAPNKLKDREEFFSKLGGKLVNLIACSDHMSIVGDFNCVNDAKDKLKELTNNPKDKSVIELNNMSAKFNMIDAWRKLNPDETQFTWHFFNSVNPQLSNASRIDKILISKSFFPYVNKCDIIQTTMSDHSPVIVNLHNIDQVERGKGLWKMNCEILKNPIFNREVKNLWTKYMLTRPQDHHEILTWWDNFKKEVREIAKEIGKVRAKIRNFALRKLEEDFNNYVRVFDMNPNAMTAKKILETREVLEKIEKNQQQGEVIRAKVSWYEEGEKSSKFFLNCEKYRAKSKLITGLKDSEGTLKKDTQGILNTAVNFYEELYKSGEVDLEAQEKFIDSLKLKLSEEDKESCEGRMSKEEVLSAIKSFKNNKSPGCDGLPKEFYVHFWDLLGEGFTNLLNECFENEKLTESMRIAIIILLYKDGDKEVLKNWRPISLLNVDYKIIAKVIATRLRKVIGKVIRPDQTCGIPGRYIHENIIFTQDCIIYANNENKPLAIVSVDMSKAFDRVNRGFLHKILLKMNFGTQFCKWISTLYNETLSQISINGHISEVFVLSRGVRQGCPLSPLLYIITAEALLEYVRSCDTVKGFVLPTGNPCSKAKGYADDGNYYLSDLISVEFLLEIIEMYGRASESKLNRDKTKLFLAGSLKNENPDHLGVKILRDKLKVLGVWLGTENCDKDNWDPIIEKVINVFKLWRMRNLTIEGRACILQTLALAKVWYVGTVLIPPKWVLESLEKEITNFLWKGKNHLINKDIVRTEKSKGGLGVFCVEDKCKVLKLKWLKIISDHREKGNSDWISLGNYFLMNYSPYFHDLEVLLINFYIQGKNNKVPPFYEDMINTWQEVKFERCMPNLSTFRRMYLWYDRFLFKTERDDFEFMSLGIYKVDDIFDIVRKEIIDCTTFVQKFCSRISRQEKVDRLRARFSIIRGELANMLQKVGFQDGNKIGLSKIEDFFIIEKQSLEAKNLYWRLRNNKIYVDYKVRKYLSFALSDNFFHKFYNTLRESDLDNKTKSLNWLISWNGVLTGSTTKNWFVEENGQCKICKGSEETLFHLFLKCDMVKEFWRWLDEKLGIPHKGDGMTLFLNDYNSLNQCQFYCYAKAKQAIWSLRNKIVFAKVNPSLVMLKNIWKHQIQRDLFIVYKAYKKKDKAHIFLERYINGNNFSIVAGDNSNNYTSCILRCNFVI